MSGIDRFRYPDHFFAEALRQVARDDAAKRDEAPVFMQRALVEAVDVKGGQLENPGAQGVFTQRMGNRDVKIKPLDGPKNPKNSIKARILTDGNDQMMSDGDLKIFYPFMPEHMAVPIKPGEHVYVTWEDGTRDHGLWMWKVSGHAGINFAPGSKEYQKDNAASLAKLFPDSAGVGSPDVDLETDDAAGESSLNDGSLTDLFSDSAQARQK